MSKLRTERERVKKKRANAKKEKSHIRDSCKQIRVRSLNHFWLRPRVQLCPTSIFIFERSINHPADAAISTPWYLYSIVISARMEENRYLFLNWFLIHVFCRSKQIPKKFSFLKFGQIYVAQSNFTYFYYPINHIIFF